MIHVETGARTAPSHSTLDAAYEAQRDGTTVRLTADPDADDWRDLGRLYRDPPASAYDHAGLARR